MIKNLFKTNEEIHQMERENLFDDEYYYGERIEMDLNEMALAISISLQRKMKTLMTRESISWTGICTFKTNTYFKAKGPSD